MKHLDEMKTLNAKTTAELDTDLKAKKSELFNLRFQLATGQLEDVYKRQGVKLAHNAGHMNALWAGMTMAAKKCDCVITIDADLQDDVNAMYGFLDVYKRQLEYLLNKYKNFVRAKARSYFLIGADHEDIVQEGMIGLSKAIRDYRGDRSAPFHAFAELCITRQIITALKTAPRQKHIPLNSYVSLNRPIYEEDPDRTLLDVITEEVPSNPESMLIDREDLSSIEGRIGEMLSDLEKEVLIR